MRASHILVLLLALSALAGGLWCVLQEGAAEAVASPLTHGVSPGGENDGSGTLPAPDSPATGGEGNSGRVASPVRAAGDEATSAARGARGAGRSVRGRVVDEFAGPVAGARVFFATSRGTEGLRLEDAVDSSPGWIAVGETTTGVAGEFELLFHQRGDLRLAVRAPGFAPLREERALKPSGESRLEDLVLIGGVSLAGHVVDRSGRGVAGASLHELAPETGGFQITVFHDGGEPLAVTDASGAFSVDELAAGPFRLRIHHPEHPDLLVRGTTERSGEIVTGLRYVLEEGFEIEGRVLGLESGEHGELAVRARPAGSDFDDPLDGHGSSRTAALTATGTFRLRGLREGRSYRLQAIEASAVAHAYFAEPRSVGVFATSGERGVELELREACALVFQVVDDRTGEAIIAFQVEAGRPWMQVLRDAQREPLREHPEGRVAYADVPLRAGETATDLRVRAKGYETLFLEDLALEPGIARDLGLLRLVPVPSVTVRVLDARERRPVEGARVTLREFDPDRPGFRHLSRVEDAGDDELDDLSLFGDEETRRGRTDGEGVAVLSSLPGRLVRLTVQHRGFAVYQGEPFPLPPAAGAELEVELLLGGTVIVRVLDSAGEVFPGQTIVHRDSRDDPGTIVFGGSESSLKSRADGTAIFKHLPAGTHHFALGESSGGEFFGGSQIVFTGVDIAEPDDGGVDLVVGEGTAETVILRARPRGSLIGKVTEGGKLLAGATLALQELREEETSDFILPGFGGGKSARTDGQGRYVLEELKTGDYTVTLTHPTRAMADEFELRVLEGETPRDFELSVAIVEGRVTDSEARPVSGVEVRPRRSRDGRATRSMRISTLVRTKGGGGAMTFSSGSRAPVVALTDAEGRYSLRGVLPGVELYVETRADDHQPARSETFEVSDGETLRGIDVEVYEAGSLQLTVLRSDGSPAAYCTAEIVFRGESEEPLEPRREFVGEGGRVTVRSLRPGPWRISVSSSSLGGGGGTDEAVPVEVEVRPGETSQATSTLP